MKIFAQFLIFLSLGVSSMNAQSFDLTKDVSSFNVEALPVILRSTEAYNDISSEIVALQITAFGGVKLAQKPGTLEVLADLLTKGTYSYSKEKINEILTRTGATLSIDPGLDAFSLQLKCLKKYLPELLPLVSEMIRVPLLEPKEIELVKQQLLTQLQAELQQPDSRLQLRSHQNFFAGHPYYSRPSGYIDTVGGITREDLSAAFFKAFNKANLMFVIVGELNKAQTTELISSYFKAIPDGRRSLDVTEAVENKTGIHFDKFEAPTTYLLAKFKAPSLESDDYPALALALQILDNRFFDEIRTKRALTYSVHAGLGNSRANSGYFYVTSTKLPETVDVMFQEVKKLQVDQVSAELLDLQVRKFLSSWYTSRETRMSQAAIFSLYEVFGIGWENSNSFIARLKKVTPADVQSVMQKYMQAFTLTVLGPKEIELQSVLSKLGFMPTDPQSLQTSQPEPAPAASETPDPKSEIKN